MPKRRYKGAPIDVYGICHVHCARFVPDFLKHGYRGIKSVARTRKRPVDKRLKNLFGKRGYYGGKRAAHDNADSHVYNVAAGDKGLEFAEKFPHIFTPLFWTLCI